MISIISRRAFCLAFDTHNLQQDISSDKGIPFLLLPTSDRALRHYWRHSRHHNGLPRQRSMKPFNTEVMSGVINYSSPDSHRLLTCPYAPRVCAAEALDKVNAVIVWTRESYDRRLGIGVD